MYSAFARSAGRQNSSANSSRASITYGLDGAAVQGALADHLHVLTALADVHGDGHDLRPVSSVIQPMHTEVSSPPE